MDPLDREEFAAFQIKASMESQCYFPIPRACSSLRYGLSRTRSSKVDHRDEKLMKKTLIGQVARIQY
mgnify:CR=1 FL=1